MVVNNPNNWHWVDKNCKDWAKSYLNQKLLDLSASNDSYNLKITKINSIEGDVEVCQRKGKIISLFDLKLILEFNATSLSDNTQINGTITVPELAYDTSFDEFQFISSIFNENNTNISIKPFIKSNLVPLLRKILSNFNNDLISQNSNDIQIPLDQVQSNLTSSNQKNSISTSSNSTKSKINDSTTKFTSNSSKKSSSSSPSHPASNSNIPKYNTSTLHIESTFNTTAEQLYLTLLDKQRVAAWSRSLPIIEPIENSDYSLFNNNIQGKLLKLIPNEKIQMTWRLNDWKQNHFANLNISFYQSDSDTKLIADFTGIPIGEEDKTENNFNNYYIRSIKLTFGFGLVL
ncbi:Aha1p ASCRUDRAFT_80384 [Ascoidea rubescens DSM 1968]|uniref:Activator of Hsp90 ATPase AHSA1-like N-terminal domain-containing protein n=1 Tax=Ascoidea rubescens DSM 1968 TaxID=1344418 RepID=A0A1D2VKG1_9ASCO|nr:hypothetical protein ASCRUDRAFT_80384 [Ascoidea rubescens DSM 1968]ODV62068.1 hypothetical protein ASCRUDRAFT_80384 [Ascoidea rubescens DSM 1968]